MYYSEITGDQVSAAYGLFRFLEKLKIIGHLMAHTERVERENGDIFGNFLLYQFSNEGYSLIKDGYSSEPRSLDAIEQLEKVLNEQFRRVNPLCP